MQGVPTPSGPLRVLLVDLWVGAGHAYYTGPMVRAMARRADVAVALLCNRRQDLDAFGRDARLLPVDAPTGFGRDHWRSVLAQPVEFVRAMRAARRFAPDVVHFAFWHPWFFLPTTRLIGDVPMVATWHNVTPHSGEATLRERVERRAMLARCAALFVHGGTLAQEAARRHPCAASRLRTIPFGHSDFVNPDPQTRAPGDGAAFLFFGRMLPYKGLEIALDALAACRASHPEAELIVAGAGDLSAHRARIDALAPNVRVINRRIPDAELQALMNECLAVLLPYTHASGSGALVAASAFGRAVIASDLGGLRDMVVEGETGRLVPPGDAAALARAMAGALDDPDGVAALGRNAREHARTAWAWEGICELQVRAYRECVDAATSACLG